MTKITGADPRRASENDAHFDPTDGLVLIYKAVRANLLLLLLIPLAATGAAYYYAFEILPPGFAARAALMPLESRQSDAQILADRLLPNVPFALDVGSTDKSSEILNYLASDSMSRRLIEHHDLLPRLYSESWDPTAAEWHKGLERVPSIDLAVQKHKLHGYLKTVQDKKTGLIELEWRDKDPAFCALMLDRIIAELERYLRDDYVSEAKRNREFIESQLNQAVTELESWEGKTPRPDLPLGTIERELMAARSVYAELKKRHAMAKIAEAEERPDFKVLDPPFVPVAEEKTRKYAACLVACLGSLFFVLFLVFFARFIRSTSNNNG